MLENLENQTQFDNVPKEVIYLIERIFSKVLSIKSLDEDDRALILASLNDIKSNPFLPNSACSISISNGYQNLNVSYNDSSIRISDIRSSDSGHGTDHEPVLDYYYEVEGFSEESGDLFEFEQAWADLLRQESEITVSEGI